ncbi:CLUMA_CG001889, isoform A [Clunio marinus]|uniref:CLUMA_CG001889, isoform A n=1 Tax=Clunio marinus TaxID=568069 RepID=A0A1J1HJ77_9DIPT|nr:CLUMA_CG001889, isoform A [Clunio marinus]
MFKIILLVSAIVLSISAQVFVQPVAHLSHRPVIAHQAVIQNSMWEQQLPPELLKSNKFYSNPRTAAHLAQESWLINGENPVYDREAEKIDRSSITKIFRNANLHKRK